jgi:predicted nucleic acid-binding protein
MDDKVFVDTNVLVYAWDSTEPEKQRQALAWMTHLWKARTGRLSYQVLTEFYITVTRKLDPGMEPERARRNVRLFFPWHPVQIDSRAVETAWQVQDRYRLSWWDALIVSAARSAGCRYLLTENFSSGQEFYEIKVVNPFLSSPGSFPDY